MSVDPKEVNKIGLDFIKHFGSAVLVLALGGIVAFPGIPPHWKFGGCASFAAWKASATGVGRNRSYQTPA